LWGEERVTSPYLINMSKVESLKNFLGLGFGDGNRQNEYYYSQGISFKRGGIEPGWKIVKQTDSSTVSSSSGMGLIQAFDERLEGTDPEIYGVDENGVLLSVKDGLTNWARLHIPGTASSGNGLIVDHSQSQRVLYIQDKYLGAFDGTNYFDTFRGLQWTTTAPKPADIYADWVAMGNSSTVALLNITDDSWNHDAFNLPPLFVIRALRAGRAGVLLGANFNNRGVLVLWDCQSDRSIAPWMWTKGKVQAIAKYKGIWVVSTGREYILTDGYSVLKSYSPPDLEETYNFGPNIPEGMVVEDDKVFVQAATPSYNRNKNGVFILDLVTGLWEFCPHSTFNTYSNATGGALFISSTNKRYASYGDSFISPNQDFIGTISGSANSSIYVSGVIGAQSPVEKKPDKVILNLSHALHDFNAYSDPEWHLYIKLYNFRRPLWGYGIAKVGGALTTQITVNATLAGYNKAEKGDEITFLEGTNAGLIRHINSISAAGTATEVWTLNKALAVVIEINARMNISPFQEVGEKWVAASSIKDDRLEIPIDKTILGRKFLMKLFIENTYGTPHIENASVFLDEL